MKDPNNKKRSGVVWEAPEEGRVKINFDGVARGDLGQGAGCVA